MTDLNTNPAHPDSRADCAGGYSSSRPSAHRFPGPIDADPLELPESARVCRPTRTSEALTLLRDWYAIRRVDDMPHFGNIRDGGNLPDERGRMGALVVFCLVVAGLSIAARFWGWV